MGKWSAKSFLALAALLFSLSGILSGSPAKAAGISGYIELVRQKTVCPDGGCFDEYLFLPNGIAIRKRLDTPDYKGLPRMEIRHIHAADLFAAAETFSQGTPATADEDQGTYELFYLKNQKLYTYSTRQPPPPALAALAQMADTLFAAGDETTPDFYIHGYYNAITKEGGAPAHDIHIFSDGTIIYSLFDGKKNTLLKSQMNATTAAGMKQLRRMADMVMLAPPRPLVCSGAIGLIYWHLEIKQHGQLRQFETCGHDDSDASALFRYMLGNFPAEQKEQAPQ